MWNAPKTVIVIRTTAKHACPTNVNPNAKPDKPAMEKVRAVLTAYVALQTNLFVNKFGSKIGLNIKETRVREDVWRTANKLNAFTGLVTGILIVLLSGYFMLNAFNWIYLFALVILAGLMLFYIPILYAKMIYNKVVNRVVE